MPRSKKSKSKRAAGAAPTARESSLGGGIGQTIVPVPKSVQRMTSVRCRGSDQMESNSGIWQFSSSGFPTVKLYTWLTGSGQWSSMATAYDQFRVKSVHLRTSPLSLAAVTAYALAYDVDGFSGTPTLPIVTAYGTSKMLSSGAEEELIYAVPALAEGQWYDVNSPSTWFGDLLSFPWLTGLSNGAYVAVLYELVVEFRGLR